MNHIADDTNFRTGSPCLGQLLRLAYQRYTSLFTPAFNNDLTPTQWSLMVKLMELGSCSQNQLGREISLDVATTKGVVDRLVARQLIAAQPDPTDARRRVLVVTEEGQTLVRDRLCQAKSVTDALLEPLNEDERKQLQKLLQRLVL